MFALIRRALRVLRYRRRWSALATAAELRADHATAKHERQTPRGMSQADQRDGRRRPE